jgi:hypothetical protein
VELCSGELNTFIIEPYIPHHQEDEYYVCIYSTKEGDTVYFYEEGGVDVGDVDSKAHRINVLVCKYMIIICTLKSYIELIYLTLLAAPISGCIYLVTQPNLSRLSIVKSLKSCILEPNNVV